MLDVPATAALPQPTVHGEKSDPLIIPLPAGVVGPAYVATGFPATTQGAVGQLAEIDVAALQALNLSTALDIYYEWALPGGVPARQWWIATSIERFLTVAAPQGDLGANPVVSAEPLAALVKGTDGPDWATVCVLLSVSATMREATERVALGHCERMQWVGGRWMIAPGDAPAPAPSTWPGTKLAAEAGWRPWLPAVTTELGQR